MNVPIDKVDPHASWAVNPPEDDGEYYCTCGCLESSHTANENRDGDECENCEECQRFVEDDRNPVEPEEPDPGRDRD
jgi:hypothetical protein